LGEDDLMREHIARSLSSGRRRISMPNAVTTKYNTRMIFEFKRMAIMN
jgi:hypothetical protein